MAMAKTLWLWLTLYLAKGFGNCCKRFLVQYELANARSSVGLRIHLVMNLSPPEFELDAMLCKQFANA